MLAKETVEYYLLTATQTLLEEKERLALVKEKIERCERDYSIFFVSMGDRKRPPQ